MRETPPTDPGRHPVRARSSALPAIHVPPRAGSADATSHRTSEAPQRADLLDRLLAQADAERGTPWPQPLAHQYARFVRDGDREEYQDVVFAREQRLSRAVVAALADPTAARVDEVADGVVLLCEQSSWCWPAHDDASHDRGTVVPSVTEPVLDLGAGEVAAQLGWIDHVLGDRLDEVAPGVRERLRHEVRGRVVDPFLERTDWWWLSPPLINWTAWIHGNVLVAGLATVEEPEVRAHLVDRVAAGIDAYVASLPDDGAIDEGYGYWWQGACRALEALEVLDHATGCTPDAAARPGLRALVEFPHRMHLGGAWFVGFADGSARPSPDQPWDVVQRWARRLGAVDAERHATAMHELAERTAADGPRPATDMQGRQLGLGRLLRALAHPWDDAASLGTGAPLVADVWLAGTQVGLARQSAGTTDGVAFAVKGGHNAESHNHCDVGSVIVALDGVPVVVDPGRPTYTAQTFGPDRYSIWTMQSSWHSVPEPFGTPQGTGPGLRARSAGLDVSDDGATARVDLTDAYPVEGLNGLARTVHLDRPDGRVVVDDAWEADTPAVEGPDGTVVVHHVLAGEVDTTTPGRAVVTPVAGTRRALLTWDPATTRARTTGRPLDDPLLSEIWGDHLTRLTLEPVEPARVRRSGHLTLTVEVHP
ncbi:heparinase [Paraoerskovia sediminicola]|uniref:Heparinase n=1 Tax=Paraoerskovia sediminicola TaxID=1138587 RepID=A0ABN6XCG2_9CELL|nr:heparinase II/III family protein [Paraoerskovia sediminicola]BDZ41475.1 heparinase [Paraoerskovia sediminicola]